MSISVLLEFGEGSSMPQGKHNSANPNIIFLVDILGAGRS